MSARQLLIGAFVFLTATWAQAATLSPQARAAYDQYIASVEARLRRQHQSTDNFIVIDDDDAESKLRRGKLLVHQFKPNVETPGAMVHHWSATMLIPGAKAADFLRVMRDFEHYPEIYSAEILQAKVLEHEGDGYKVLMRITQHRFVTVVLDAQFAATFGALDAAHGYTTSKATEITEIANAGKSSEHAVEPGQEHGFLWSLNLYWSYVERPDGLLVQCEAVSLTRDIPRGWAWLIKPLVQSIPRDALTYTLSQTRKRMQVTLPATSLEQRQ